jgi:hypothetical protein
MSSHDVSSSTSPRGARRPGIVPAFDAAHRRYLLIEQGVGAAIFNLLLNGVLAWLSVRSLERVPLWGETSIAVDTLFTTFLLPFFTCLIVTRLALGMVRKGKLPPVAWRRADHATLRRLPARTVTRALLLGLVGLVAFGPVMVWAFAAFEVREMGVWSFVTYKALFAAALAAIFTPLIAVLALGDSSPSALD